MIYNYSPGKIKIHGKKININNLNITKSMECSCIYDFVKKLTNAYLI